MSGSDNCNENDDNHRVVELTEFGASDATDTTTCSSQESAALLDQDVSESNQSQSQSRAQAHSSPSPELQRARRLLYLSHLFAQGSEQAWQFSLTIFLSALTNYKSLLLVSTYGLTTGLAVALLGSTTGSWIDRTNRLVAARGFIFAENVCVAIATVFCFVLLAPRHQDSSLEIQADSDEQMTTTTTTSSTRISASVIPTDFSSIFLMVGIHILGAAARVLDESFLVAMERDWVVVMSRYDHSNMTGHTFKDNPPKETNASKAWLSETNVAMKQIDLSCKVVAPAISGFLIAWVDNREAGQTTDDDQSQQDAGSQFQYAALVVGAINVLALLVEYYCTTIIYQIIPDLAFLRSQEEDSNLAQHDDENDEEEEEITNATQTMGQCASSISASLLPEGLQIYLKQTTAPAGIGLSLLYLNALTFDAIMTSYLVWRNMGLETIGIWRGVSSAIGLLGTCVYHLSAKRMSLESTGQWSIMYEFACLSLSYGSLFVDDNISSLGMLIAGVCASRIGLWVFDITVTQMMQEYIPDGIRGVVGGVQQSLNASFHLLSYALGIIFPDPKDFHIYVAAGYASVGIAVVLYSFGTFFPNRQSLHSY